MDSQLDLNQLRTFFTLVQAGSFSETAHRLHRTQSAISHAIRKLEELAGVVVVDRRVRDLRLTDEGRRLYQACESVFATLDGVCEDFQQGRSLSLGRIRLGTTIEFGCHVLMKQMAVFLKQNPGIEIDFTLGPDLLEPLLRDDVDIAIDCVEHFRPEFQKIPLFRESYTVACAPNFMKEHDIKQPSDLSRCPMLSMEKSGAWWHRFLLTLPEGQRPELRRIIAVNHIRGMVHAAVHGLGVVLAPKHSVQGECDRGQLVQLFPSIQTTEDSYYCFFLYQKANKARLGKHRQLVAFLQTIKMSDLDPL
jgi:DNA-binding transcriptional LysR family regulator